MPVEAFIFEFLEAHIRLLNIKMMIYLQENDISKSC